MADDTRICPLLILQAARHNIVDEQCLVHDKKMPKKEIVCHLARTIQTQRLALLLPRARFHRGRKMGKGAYVGKAKDDPQLKVLAMSEKKALTKESALEGYDIVQTNRIVRGFAQNEEMKVGVDGSWYDVTQFAKHHPGGDIIYEFLGKDATSQFHAFHSSEVLKRFKPKGTYKVQMDPAEAAFVDFVVKLEERGFFKPEMTFYAKKVAVCVALFAGVIAALHADHLAISSLCLGLFWMQVGHRDDHCMHVLHCGRPQRAGCFQAAFLTHDLMHNQIFKNRKRDQVP